MIESPDQNDPSGEFSNGMCPEISPDISEITGFSRKKIMRGLASLHGLAPAIVLFAAIGCGSVTESGSGGGGGAGGAEQNVFTCEAAGSDRPQLISEWDIYNMLGLDSYATVTDQDGDPDNARLDYTGVSPNDKSTFYRCTYGQVNQCDLTVDAAPDTRYEAAQLRDDMHTIRWYTWPENGETGPRTSDKPLNKSDYIFIHVVSDPAGTLSYPAVIKSTEGCVQ